MSKLLVKLKSTDKLLIALFYYILFIKLYIGIKTSLIGGS